MNENNKQRSITNLSQRTALLLIKDTKVLLGYKKSGFGKGNYLGIGGKVEDGETNEVAAIREAREEISISNPNLKKVGNLTFLFPEKPDWSQQVHVFVANDWEGDPEESNEIKPYWFSFTELPLTKMWDDAQFWLPAILNGHKLEGKFVFNSDLKVLEVELKEFIANN